VIDDDATIRDALCEQLTWAGHQVVAASTGAEALELLRHEPSAVILSDHQMPEMSGVELLAMMSKIMSAMASNP